MSLPIGRYKLRAGLERLGFPYRPSGDGKVISPDGRYLTAHTGAAAVALLAESPGLIDDTPFYDGEAWFALAYDNEVFPRDDSVARILESLDASLMTRYANDVKTGFYQWGTMAAARRLKATSNQKFVSFIRGQVQTFLFATSNVVSSQVDQLSAMWNHGRQMENLAKRRAVVLPTLTAQELSDITRYLAGLATGAPVGPPRPK